MPEDQLVSAMHCLETLSILDKPSFRSEKFRIITIYFIKLRSSGIKANVCSTGNAMAIDNITFWRHHSLAKLADRSVQS